MKTCTKCGLEKDKTEFGNRSGKQSHLLKSWCKSCQSNANSERLRERYHNEPGHKENLAKYAKDNPDKVKVWKSRHYEANREHYIQQSNEWRDAHRPEIRQIKRRYKTRRKGWEATGSYTTEEWLRLCDQYGSVCLCCKVPGLTLTADHVIPLSLGGSNDISNIQPLCGPCNSRKHTKTTDYRIGE